MFPFSYTIVFRYLAMLKKCLYSVSRLLTVGLELVMHSSRIVEQHLDGRKSVFDDLNNFGT